MREGFWHCFDVGRRFGDGFWMSSGPSLTKFNTRIR